jgi:5S rRNA maturation endonuclease (ribonuclease M5)
VGDKSHDCRRNCTSAQRQKERPRLESLLSRARRQKPKFERMGRGPGGSSISLLRRMHPGSNQDCAGGSRPLEQRPKKKTSTNCWRGWHGNDFNNAPRQRIKPEPEPKKEEWGPWQEVSPPYAYTDADGKLLYQVVRKERLNAAGDKEKKFPQRRPDGKGGWEWKQGEQRVLYRWPDLVNYPDATVFVCEGEKDSDRLASLGYCATTVANGNWKDVDVSCIKGRDVIVLEDADGTGVKKAAEAAAKLQGVAKTLRVVRLPGHEHTADKHGRDVIDWLDEDPTRAETFEKACFDAPLWEAKTEDAPPHDDDWQTPQDPGPFDVADFTSAAPERHWIVQDWIAEGVVNSLYGAGGIGKTLLAQQLAYSLATATPFLGIPVESKTSFCVLCEDDLDELHRRHDAIAAGIGVPPKGTVTVWPRVGLDNLLVTWDHKNEPHLTKQFKAG